MTAGFDLEQGTYRTPPRQLSAFARMSPSTRFYVSFVPLVLRCARLARRGGYDAEAWVQSSHDLRSRLEWVGVQISADGLEHVAALDGPCVFVANHMSLLEALVLPGFIQPLTPVTFVVKETLGTYPVFKHIMLAREPILVSRTDPRADFQTVMEQGKRELDSGRSMIIFPQTTRTLVFDRKQFNSIGVKLARRAGVPVVPIAIRSDAWAMSKHFVKDLGRIDPSIPVRFAFGAPIPVTGRGTEAQERSVDFIESHLTAWGSQIAPADVVAETASG